MRVLVARGSMPYSAVTQPFPVLRRNPGTRSSTLAVQMTFVWPALISTDPPAWIRSSGMIVVSRSLFEGRLSDRILVSLLDPAQILGERLPQIDMAGERLDFLAVDEHLHGGDRGQVDGERVDDRVNSEQLVQRPAGMRADHLATEIDVGFAAVGEKHRAQCGAPRYRGQRGLGDRRKLRRDDLARLRRRTIAVGHVTLDAGEPHPVGGNVEQT